MFLKDNGIILIMIRGLKRDVVFGLFCKLVNINRFKKNYYK